MKLASQNQNGLFWDWCVCICRCNFNLKVALYFGISLGIPCLPSLFSKPNIWRFTNDRERERDMLITCVYTIVTFACAKLSLIPKPQSHKSSFEKIYWSNFFSLLINAKLGGKRQKKEEKCTESTATVFSKISEQKKEEGKKFYLSQNNCSKRKSFWLDYNCNFPSSSLPFYLF